MRMETVPSAWGCGDSVRQEGDAPAHGTVNGGDADLVMLLLQQEQSPNKRWSVPVLSKAPFKIQLGGERCRH